MAGAFQPNAFQNNAFQTSAIVSSLNIPYPVNCVLIGSQVGELLSKVEWKKPTFTVRTNNKGYD